MKKAAPKSSVSHTAANFAETQWTIVLAAGGASSSRAAAALETLCRTYWPPIYAFVRHRGYPQHDAQDITQDFFLRLLRGNLIARADPEIGRFRSFLLVSLKRFLADGWDKARTLKRGGGKTVVSLDELQAEERWLGEPAADTSPEASYDSRWAMTLLDGALRRLRDQCSPMRQRQFDLLKCFLTEASSDVRYREVAEQLGTSANAVAVAVHRMRQRYREMVRAEVAQTVLNGADAAEELRRLFGGC
jgi:RNA polymerase sigma-70 factor (ECF subfamily)